MYVIYWVYMLVRLYILLSKFSVGGIHISSLMNIEKISNRPITKFYESNDMWLQQSYGSLKRGQLLLIWNIIFYKKQWQQMQIKFWKVNVKNISVISTSMACSFNHLRFLLVLFFILILSYTFLSIYLSIYLPIYQSVCLSIY